MKYKDNFNRDFNWYIKMRNHFDFDGKPPYDIEYNPNGIDFKKAFHIFDSTGILNPTKHPTALANVLKVKSGINLHIKMYSEDRASGLFSLIEFRALCIKLKSPFWFRQAVERQKFKYIV